MFPGVVRFHVSLRRFIFNRIVQLRRGRQSRTDMSHEQPQTKTAMTATNATRPSAPCPYPIATQANLRTGRRRLATAIACLACRSTLPTTMVGLVTAVVPRARRTASVNDVDGRHPAQVVFAAALVARHSAAAADPLPIRLEKVMY